MTKKGKFVINTSRVEKTIQDTADNNTRNSKFNISFVRKLEFILALTNRLLIGFITIYMCWMCLRIEVKDLPWHALLCTIGFVCLMSEGLLVYYQSNAWTQLCYRTEKTRTHWILQLCGSLLGLCGIIIKVFLEEIHFESLHAKFGLATLVICLSSLLSGLSALYANELKNRLQPLFNKSVHSLLGLITFTMAMLSMCTAFETDIFMEYSLDASNYLDFRLLMQIVVILILVLSSYGPWWCFIYSKLWRSN